MTVQEFATYAFLACVVVLWATAWTVRRINRFRRRHRGAIGFAAGLFAGHQTARRKTDRRSAPPPPPGAPVPTILYRHYDAGGRLLYVGITCRGQRRWEEHDADKPWFPLVATSRVEDYPSRPAALYAEAVAIQRENPVYNIQRPDPRAIGRRAAS